MSRSATSATRITVGIFVVSVTAMALALGLWVVAVEEPFSPDIVLFPLAYLTFAAVGVLVLVRRPDNRIGQLCLAAGAGGAIAGLADSYARLATPVPGQAWAAWLGSVGFPASLGPILFVILLFPTGRLASTRWRIVALSIVAGMLIVAVGNAFSPTFADFAEHSNPIGVAAFAGSPLEQGGVGWFLVLFGAVAAAIGLIPRLRRATGIERAQLKWITLAATIHGASWLVLALDLPGAVGEAAQWVLFGTLTFIPVAAGIAILRYRLYDIDVVVRRTLVYGGLVVILGAVYVALVLALQASMAGLTGGQTLPVALSTLVIAALFGPLRRRVRAVVDRRFYRSRYDAQQTLAQFSAHLRDEVELDAVGRTLVATAGRAVRPATAAVWLRRSVAR